MADYMPQSDAIFNGWQGELLTVVEPNLSVWGISETDFGVVKSKQSIWTTAYAKTVNKQNRTAADVLARDEAGDDYKKTIRNFVAQWLASNPRVSDVERLRMGLTVKTGTRTLTPVPTTFPIGTIDFSVRLQHSISYYDEASAHSNAKPAGIHGCEIYMKVDGDAPKDVSELDYVGTCTASPYTVKFDDAKVGKTIYYRLRWVNTRGEAGPWSTIINALVMG